MVDQSPPRLQPWLRLFAARPNLRPADMMLVLFLGFLGTRAREANAYARAAAASPPKGAAGQPPAAAGVGAVADTASEAAQLIKDCDRLVEQVNTKGPPYPTWDQAYRIERELVTLQYGDRLHQTLKGLLDRADSAKLADAPSLRKLYEGILPRILDDKKPPDLVVGSEPLLLPLALVALEKVQWEQAKTFKAVPLKRRAIHRLVSIEAVVFLFFVIPFAYTDLRAAMDYPIEVKDWSWLPLWIALTGGLLGAFFSRLWSLQSGLQAMTLEEVENAGDWANLVLRGAVGMLGSLVVFFFLQSGIIQGNLFPSFSDIFLQQVVSSHPLAPGDAAHRMMTVPSQQLAMMVIWSFLAGFSQKLVPDILSKTEAQLSAATSPATAGKTAGV